MTEMDGYVPVAWLCWDCNHDTHTCPGCGVPLDHGEICCDDCYRSAIAG